MIMEMGVEEYVGGLSVGELKWWKVIGGEWIFMGVFR